MYFALVPLNVEVTGYGSVFTTATVSEILKHEF